MLTMQSRIIPTGNKLIETFFNRTSPVFEKAELANKDQTKDMVKTLRPLVDNV
jgi:hypothetical protein